LQLYSTTAVVVMTKKYPKEITLFMNALF